MQMIWIPVSKVMAYLDCRYPGKHCILNELLGLFPPSKKQGFTYKSVDNISAYFSHTNSTPTAWPGGLNEGLQRHDPFLQPRSAESPSTL